jgi:GAF domain-containing protein/HAMP domain-containing protein
MSLKSSITHPVFRAYEFKGSLARNIVFILLLISLIPLLLVGSSTIIRTRQVLLENAETQMNALLDDNISHYVSIKNSGNRVLQLISSSDEFMVNYNNFIDDPDDILTNQRFLVYLVNARNKFSVGDNINFTELSVFNKDGLVIASSDSTWQNANFGINPKIQRLLNQSTQYSYALFDPSPMYSNELVFFFTTPIDSAEDYVLVGTYIEDNSSRSIDTSNSFYPDARSFFLMEEQTLVGIDSLQTGALRTASFPNEYKTNLFAATQEMDPAGFAIYPSYDNVDVVGTIRSVSDIGLAIILELPEQIIYQQVSLLGPINFLLLAISLLISGILVYFVSARIIRPLVRLSEHARDFSLGDWNQRAVVNRNDEIGLLAHSFNQMVEQITDLYYSLEQKVENRTEQLGIASEVMQIVTSSTQRDDLLSQSANLLAERFHYPYVSIYLVDPQGANAVLQRESGNYSDYFSPVRPRIRLGTDSIISTSIDQNRIETNNLQEETPDHPLPQSARHESSVPITFANQVLGSIYLQSPKHQPFDEEILPILQTISNQIASGLQSTLLLESAQINLEETTLLYRASRQITQATSVDEITEIIQQTMAQTSYLNGLFIMEDEHLTTKFLYDPIEPWRKIRFSDQVSIERFEDQLFSSPLILLSDLSVRSDLDSLLAYFIQYNCTSSAVFPIQVNNKLNMVVVLASRNPDPITETALQPYSNLIEVVKSALDRLSVLSTLELRAQQLQTTAEIARDTSASLNLDELLRSSINLIRERFGFYHASVFLLDPFKEYAELKESTGEAGRVLKEIKHKLAVGSSSVVGQATALNSPQIINDVSITENYYPNPQLPDTKSELAIPLSIGTEVLGAIDVQSTEINAFSPEDIQILQILADQLATAVLNATLFAQTTGNLSQYRLLQEITTKVSASGSPEEALLTTVSELRNALPYFNVAIFTPLSAQTIELKASVGFPEAEEREYALIQVGDGIIGQAAQKRENVFLESTQDQDKMQGYRSEFALPILYQNRLLGILYTRTDNPATIHENYQEFFQALISSLGSIISNSELIQRIRIQIERQKQIYDVTTKIRRSVDFQTILQTSATEIGRHLGAQRSKIIIHPEIRELSLNPSDNGNQPADSQEA